MSEKTTDLDKLKKGDKFVWGKLLEILEIGEYSIVKYSRRQEKTIAYSSYINGKRTSCSWNSLDDALASCIAEKYEGTNSHASIYFMAGLRHLKENNNN